MKNCEIKNKRKNEDRNLKTILSIWYFKSEIFPHGRLMKHKYRLCEHVGIKKWGVKYWRTYALVVNWIRVRSILYISSKHEAPNISIDLLITFS